MLLSSLAPSPKEPGITEDEVRTASDRARLRLQLLLHLTDKIPQIWFFFHERGGSFYFDSKENAHSKVNLRSQSISDEDAWDKVVSWWYTDLLRDQDAVVFSDPLATRQTLDARPSADVRLVIAPRKLSNDQIHELYFGLKTAQYDHPRRAARRTHRFTRQR